MTMYLNNDGRFCDKQGRQVRNVRTREGFAQPAFKSVEDAKAWLAEQGFLFDVQ